MATIQKEVELAVSAEELWARVSDVGGLSRLLNVVEKSSVDGDERSCVLADGAELSEAIVAVDDALRRVAYTITAGPFPLEFHAASMQVSDAGGGRSTFCWTTDLKPDSLAEPFDGLMGAEVAQLGERYGT